MNSRAVVASVVVLVGIIVAVVIDARAHRALSTEEIVQLTKHIHEQTGVDPTKPQGFVLQSDGTWAPMHRDQAQKQP
ncbi:MAG: hypothetical protein ACJ8KU_05155 [Chthoniobacterales bacterium]